MFRPVRMNQLNMVVFEDDIDKVTEEIIKIGAIHFVKISQIEEWASGLDSLRVDEIGREYDDLYKRTRGILRRLGISEEQALSEHVEKKKTLGAEDIQRALDEIESKINPYLLDKESKKAELKVHQDIYNQVDLFNPYELGIPTKAGYSFLETVTGEVDEKNFQIIKGELDPIPNVVMPFRIQRGKVTALIIVLKRDKVVLDRALKESSFTRLEVPEEMSKITGDVKLEIRKKIKGLQEEVAGIDKSIAGVKKDEKEVLSELLNEVRANQLLVRAKSYFKKTNKTYIVSGWIPSKSLADVVKAVKKVTEGKCYIEGKDADKIEAVKTGRVKVPVKFSNPKFLKPFEMLTTGYGLPEYSSIDPTIFVALTFLIMFGAMFGDVGHGLVLAFLGILLFRNRKPLFKKAGVLGLYCGFTSIIFGFLYGSVFGIEHLIPSLWLKPIHNITQIMLIAVGFGIVVISIGILINIVDALRSRNFVRAVFDKAGLIGGVIYWGAVGIGIKVFMQGQMTLDKNMVLAVIGVPVLILFLKAPIVKLFKRKEKIFPEGITSYVMETMVELIEIFMGYLANTVSFIRIAAFALAHAGLFIAVFSLVDILKSKPAGTFWAVLTLVLGNIIIIALEGLIVTIQGIRLEYYEFFSKFFEGGGKVYEPVGAGTER